MTVQEKVLKILLKQRSTPVSGQNIAEKLNVSRNSVWKAVKNLKNSGYIIETIPRKGYQLKQITKQLDSTLIHNNLNASWKNLKIITKDSVSSTNDLAKQHLIKYPEEDLLVASKKQTHGRGRRGKNFHSDIDNGLYFSLGFQPATEDLDTIPLYTVLAASVLVETLEDYLDDSLKIKWVNDIFYKGYKISGILSEITNDLESGGINGVIIGVGINLAGDFDKADRDIQEVAGSLFGKSVPQNFNQNIFLAEFLKLFSRYEKDLNKKSFLSIYKDHLLGLNQAITYKHKNQTHSGIIKGIDENAHLIIEQENGEVETLMGQEISFTSRQFIEKEDISL